MRSTIINFFRVPLNLFVCVVLYNVRRAQGLRVGVGLAGGGPAALGTCTARPYIARPLLCAHPLRRATAASPPPAPCR